MAPSFGRSNPKDFRQRLPDGTWGLGKARRVLYNLPALLEAVRAEQRVFITEGERNVHAAEQAGLVATCNRGAAGKWRAEYSESLRGSTVTIVSDADGPGRKHAQEVARSVAGVAESVVVVEPAEGCKDMSDHLGAARASRTCGPSDPTGDWLAGAPMDPAAVAADPLPSLPGFPYLHSGAGSVIVETPHHLARGWSCTPLRSRPHDQSLPGTIKKRGTAKTHVPAKSAVQPADQRVQPLPLQRH